MLSVWCVFSERVDAFLGRVLCEQLCCVGLGWVFFGIFFFFLSVLPLRAAGAFGTTHLIVMWYAAENRASASTHYTPLTSPFIVTTRSAHTSKCLLVSLPVGQAEGVEQRLNLFEVAMWHIIQMRRESEQNSRM